MKRVWIDGKHINDMASLHRLVSVALGFPSYYGNNLDALYDCLTDLFEETEITVTNAEYLKKNLEKAFRNADLKARAPKDIEFAGYEF